MKTEHELHDDIMKITMKIDAHHPELIQYINEMPETNPARPDQKINRQMLTDYYESLKHLFIKYSNYTTAHPI